MSRIGNALSLTAVACAALVGCNESSSGSATASAPSTDKSVNAASAAFQTIFQSGSSSSASDLLGSQAAEIESANTQLKRAYLTNPKDSKAAFGLAVTTLALRMNSMSGTLSTMQENGLGLNASGKLFSGTPADVNASIPVLARSMANPAKAPLLSDIQDSLEIGMLPTVDSVANLLTIAWNDPEFELSVVDKDDGDILVIDRGDIGYALAIVKAVQAELNWMVSYNINIDVDGSYAWLEALSNDNTVGDVSYPATAAQQNAVKQIQAFLTSGSSFLKVRPGKESRLASTLTGLREAIDIAKAATNASYLAKKGTSNHLKSITTVSQRDDVLEVLDSAGHWLSGPRTVTLDNGNSVTFDLSKLITLSDLKLFLPSSYVWNNNFDASWSKIGPILWTNGSSTIAMDSVFGLAKASKSYLPFKNWIRWSDPTVGGVFPGMTQGGLFDLAFKGTKADPTVNGAPKLSAVVDLLP